MAKPTNERIALLGGLLVALGVALQTCADVQPAPVEAHDTDAVDSDSDEVAA